MPQSTPLDRIENDDIPDSHASDEERVQNIVKLMNNTNESHNSPGEEQYPPQQMMPQQMMPQQMMPQQMMPQQMMQPQMMHPQMMQPQYMMQAQAPYQQPTQQTQNQLEEEPTKTKKNIWAHITDVLKLPFVVSIVFFVVSLPFIDVYLSKYASWAFKSGGQLSISGLALKAVSVGLIMGIYDTLDKIVSRFF